MKRCMRCWMGVGATWPSLGHYTHIGGEVKRQVALGSAVYPARQGPGPVVQTEDTRPPMSLRETIDSACCGLAAAPSLSLVMGDAIAWPIIARKMTDPGQRIG